ncbi:hypothetical protein [Mesorhizobium sp. M7A.F.Ca.CA.004.02.1.1]|uniref:hypothetical protein n=1 Tax=Mesorhizobium sp. M7A.F.Ca.CA.004.02.1.1 TaxID=2496690 RepID=UPI000FCC8A69|nr:hypothetical protein [Mesorhizobium sp. M7A.F.Ca.CA.004.02.1.1]RVB02839.1 hypothetical protein EN912_10330 [Mesorhizobium sp. M7A.F.Ca.CA.004.02.1.1]
MSKFNTGDTVRRIRCPNGAEGVGLQIGETDVVTGHEKGHYGYVTTAKYGDQGNDPANLELVSSAPKVGDSFMVTKVPEYWWIKPGMVGVITGHSTGTYAFKIKIGTQTGTLNPEHFVVVPKIYLRDMTAFEEARAAQLRAMKGTVTGRIIRDEPMLYGKPIGLKAPKVNKQAPIKSVKVDPAAILALLTDYVKGTLGIDAQVTKIVSSFEKSFDLVLKAEA